MTSLDYLVNGERAVIHCVYPEKANVSRDILAAAGVDIDPGHKAGGLGEYASGFDHALRESDRFDVHTFFPASPTVLNRLSPLARNDLVTRLAKQGVHLITHTSFKSGIYGGDGAHKDYEKAVILSMMLTNSIWNYTGAPHLVHCHDWTTGMIPAAAKQMGTKSVFTVHNHYGRSITPRKAFQIGFDASRGSDYSRLLFFDQHPDQFSDLDYFHNARINMLASGIHAACMASAVSPTYANELVNGSDFAIPHHVRATIGRKHADGRVVGILNNVDDKIRSDVEGKGYVPFTPETNVAGKTENKRALQERMKLRKGNFPIYFMPSRLVEQKGVRLLHDKMEAFSRQHGAQFVIVANGDDYERIMGSIAVASNGMIGYHKFNEPLSMLGFAGSDFTLMPSQYEPAGLAHRVGYRFGCPTIARRTGGLADSVEEFDGETSRGNGFLFDQMSGDQFWNALHRSLSFYALPDHEKSRQRERIMREDLGKTAKDMVEQYVQRLYLPCLDELRRGII